MVLALLILTGEARAQFVTGSDCTKLSMRLKGIPEAAGARCVEGGEYFGDEIINASGPGTTFVIRHQRGGLNYYLVRQEVSHIVKKMRDAARRWTTANPSRSETSTSCATGRSLRAPARRRPAFSS